MEPAIGRHLRRIVDQTTAGDPMSFLRWTSKSTRAIAEEVTRLGYPMTPTTVARCLHDLGYSLQANVKTIEGRQHPDRDAQFRYINARVRLFQRTGDPVVSVDTKKKELIGAFRNAGRTWRPEVPPSGCSPTTSRTWESARPSPTGPMTSRRTRRWSTSG